MLIEGVVSCISSASFDVVGNEFSDGVSREASFITLLCSDVLLFFL